MNITLATCTDAWAIYPDRAKRPDMSVYLPLFSQAKSHGYLATEINMGAMELEDADVLKGYIEKYELPICANIFINRYTEQSFDEVKPKIVRQLEMMKKLGIKYLMQMDDADMATKANWPAEKWNRFFDNEKKTKEMADEAGVTIVFHQHANTTIETIKECDDLFGFTGVKMCLDIGHFILSNATPDTANQVIRDFTLSRADNIEYVHFKNASADGMALRQQGIRDPNRPVFTEFDKGVIDFAKFRQDLEDINFNGYGIVEQDLPPQERNQPYAIELSKRNVAHLKAVGLVK